MGLYRTPLTRPRGEELLRIARETVTAQVTRKPLPEPACDDPRLAADGAAFVTLKGKGGELRGCIGAIQPVEPLCRSVRNNAVAAASRDRRFVPVRPEELAGLDIEITVLSPLEPVTGPDEIHLGTHGVYLQAQGTSSVFLPQVAPEQGWDLATTLQQLARKAGLPADGWKQGQLYRFTAEIVHEEAETTARGKR
jgi:AmmeMemoRadiSam system protein A